MKTFTKLSLIGAVSLAAAAPAVAADGTTPSASTLCKQELTAMGEATFKQTYGTNANRSNAFGKCVSKRQAKTAEAEKTAKTSANAQCKTEQAADEAAFTKKYGTGKKGANAFGKCVSAKAKTAEATEVKAQTKDNVNAAKTCKAAKKADAAAFAAKWGTKANAFGKCVSSTAKASAAERKAA